MKKTYMVLMCVMLMAVILFIFGFSSGCNKKSPALPAELIPTPIETLNPGVHATVVVITRLSRVNTHTSDNVSVQAYVETDGISNSSAVVACNLSPLVFDAAENTYKADAPTGNFGNYQNGVTLTVILDGHNYSGYGDTFKGQTINAQYDMVSWDGSATASRLNVYKVLSPGSFALTYSGSDIGHSHSIPASAYPDISAEYKVELYLKKIHTDNFSGGDVASGCSMTVEDFTTWNYTIPGIVLGTTQTAQDKIAFVNYYGSNMDIFLVDPDGGNLVRVTNEPTIKEWLAWSPDKTKIAFSTNKENRRNIYTIGKDASGLTNITDNLVFNTTPSWSPDGSKIAYVSTYSGNQELCVINADGTGNTRLTYSAGDEFHPCWSADGSKILFERYNGESKLYTVSADGTGEFLITTDSNSYSTPSWSPDNLSIIFISSRDGTLQIYKMNSDGTNTVKLTNIAGGVGSGGWSPDGSKITFSGYASGKSDIYVMNADGTGVTKISSLLGQNNLPVWR